MRRLFVQIWLGFLLVGVVSLAVSGVAAALMFGAPERGRIDAVTVWEADGTVSTSTGPALPFGEPGWFRTPEVTGVRVALPNGRSVGAGHLDDPGRRLRFVGWLWILSGVVAVGCWPLARRITHRLERVRAGLDAWGRGDLSVRVPVSGRDEVASVARTFNLAADRLQASFEAQRRVLASASHELRSPLARVRMALELLDDGDPERRARVADAVRDVEELDALVGDLLQVGRMQALGRPEDPRPVDLRALLEEEAARVGATVTGPPSTVEGEARLLRSLARNLLENAVRHGAPPIEITVTASGFEVADRGPGVPEELRERVFEPFFRPAGHAEGRDGGVGLGLHLVREIARYHGGTVTLTGRDGGGSVFRVDLPPR